MKKNIISILAILVIALMISMSAYVAVANASNNVNAIMPDNSSTIRQGGTAILLPSPYESFVDSFNPFNPSVYPDGITAMFYEPLFQVNPLNGTTIPWLATGYNWTNNYNTLSVNLRHNVTFSNGETFNASDVVFTFNLMKKYPAIDTYGVWNYLKNVTEVSPYKVDFNFITPDVPLFYYINLVLIVPKSIWQNVSNPATYTDSNPIGTGPFVLGSFSSSKIELNRNPNYWQPNEPHLNHLVYYAYTSNNAADLALEDGQVDWAGLFVPGLQKLYVSKDPSNYGYYFAYETPVSLYTNNMKWPLNQSFFREAMSLSINRTKIYKQGEYGYETPALGLSMIIGQAGMYLNSTNIAKAKEITQYNVTEAKSILSSHGYSWNSKGQLVASNGTLVPTMTIMTPAGWTDWDADISIEASEFASIGLTVNVVTPVYSSLYADLEDGNYWIIQYSNTEFGPTPYYGFYGEYYDQGNVTPMGVPSGTDFERFNSSIDNFNTLLLNMQSTSNKTLEMKYTNEIASILLKEIPTVSVVNAAMWYEWNNKTIGGFPSSSNNYWIGSPWQTPADEVVALHLYSKISVAKVTPPVSIYYYIIPIVIILGVIGAITYIIYNKRKEKMSKIK